MQIIYRKGEYLAQSLAITERAENKRLSNPIGEAVPTVYGTVNYAPPIIANQLKSVKKAPATFHILPQHPARIVVYGLSQNVIDTPTRAVSTVDKIFFDGVNINKKNLNIISGKEDSGSSYIGSNTGAAAGKYIAWFQRAQLPGSPVNTLLDHYGIDFNPYYMDYLVVAYKMETDFEAGFDNIPELSVTYRRQVFDRLGTSGIEDTHASVCIDDYLGNLYGFRLASNKIDHTSFTNNKNRKIGVVLDNENNTLIDNLEILINADNGMLYQDGTKLYYNNESDAASADFTINEDSIIGNIGIIHPEAEEKIDVLEGEYYSHEGGSRLLSIGSGDRVKSIDLPAFSTRAQAEIYLQQTYNKIRNQRTFEFMLDRSGHQIVLGDILSVTTTYPSLTNQLMRVVRIEMDTENYTFNLECIEHDNDFYAPFDDTQTELIGSTPLIPISGGSYKPPEYEFDFPDGPGLVLPDPPAPEPPDADPPPDEGETRPTIPTQTTVTNADPRHPWNPITNSYNTDWYLGTMNVQADGSKTLDEKNFDPNGIDVVPLEWENGMFYQVRWALTWRYEEFNTPDMVYCLMDIPYSPNKLGMYRGQGLAGRYYDFKDVRSLKEGEIYSKYVSQSQNTDWQGPEPAYWPNLTNTVKDGFAYASFARTFPNHEDSFNPNNYPGVFESHDGSISAGVAFKVFWRREPNPANSADTLGNTLSRIQDDFPTNGTDNKFRFHFFEVRQGVSRYIGYTTSYVDGRSMHTTAKQSATQRIWNKYVVIPGTGIVTYPYSYTATGVQ